MNSPGIPRKTHMNIDFALAEIRANSLVSNLKKGKEKLWSEVNVLDFKKYTKRHPNPIM